MSEEDLGPAAPWNVRAVPENIRKAYVDRAQREGVTVGELLTKMVVGGEGPAPAHQAVDVDRLLKLLQAGELLGKAGLKPHVTASARVTIENEIRALRRKQRQVQRLALVAPR